MLLYDSRVSQWADGRADYCRRPQISYLCFVCLFVFYHFLLFCKYAENCNPVTLSVHFPKLQQNVHIVNKSSSHLNPDPCELFTGSF